MNKQLNSKATIRSIVLALASVLCGTSSAAPIQEDIFSRPSDKQPAEENPATETSNSVKKKPKTPSIKPESTAEMTKQSDGWFTIKDKASSSEWRFPGKPVYDEFGGWKPIAGRPPVLNHFYKVLVDGRTEVALAWMDLHDSHTGGTKLKNALDGAVRGAVVNVIGQLDKVEKIKLGRIEGREYEYTYSLRPPQGKKDIMISGKARVFIKGKRQYQMHVLTPKGKEEPELTEKFFESFLITDE